MIEPMLPPVGTWAFWRSAIMYFCIFSVVGHLMEIPYCLFNDALFNIVDDNSGVFTSCPLKPFMVYGFGTFVCALTLNPLRVWLISKNRGLLQAAVEYYAITVLLCMLMELGMGLLMNQPVDGVYPLWDNSQLPGNILGQAWIVNDLLLGLITSAYVWLCFPWMERLQLKLPTQTLNIACAVIVVLFVALTLATYGTELGLPWGA